MNENSKHVPEGATQVRQEFGAMQAQAPVETQAMAMAAQAKAMVEARYVMAMQRPRIWDQVRQDILKECRRPLFARNASAFYIKPIGPGVEGLGIRFAEVAIRCMTNMLIETSMMFEDEGKEIHRVSVTDLEGNITYPLDIRVTKSVERSKPDGDGSYISARKNSRGRVTYTVEATDDDLLNKRAALISKAVRTLALRLVPGDIQDEATAIIKAIRQDHAAQDPDAEKKALADGFHQMGVKASELVEYLGHALDSCSPVELANLRALWGAIRNGEASWPEALQNARNQRDEAQEQHSAEAATEAGRKAEAKNGSRVAGVAAKMKAQQETQQKEPKTTTAPAVTLEELTAQLPQANTPAAWAILTAKAKGLSKAEQAVFNVMLEAKSK